MMSDVPSHIVKLNIMMADAPIHIVKLNIMMADVPIHIVKWNIRMADVPIHIVKWNIMMADVPIHIVKLNIMMADVRLPESEPSLFACGLKESGGHDDRCSTAGSDPHFLRAGSKKTDRNKTTGSGHHRFV